MKITQKVKKILDNYESDNPGTKANLARILMHGKLGGSGKLVILPVDQGFEHGPARSFAPNPPAYDPHYHFQLAIDAGLSAYAAPLGMIEAGADSFAGAIPTILKVNSSNSLARMKDQAVHGSVKDALRLGCAAIGFTIYPGADDQFEMMEEIREMSEEAKAARPRDGDVVLPARRRPHQGRRDGDGRVRLCDAHGRIARRPHHQGQAADPGAVPGRREEGLPGQEDRHLERPARIAHVVQSAFNGRRVVVFSGGEAKDDEGIFAEARAIRDGGGNGSIIGRNTFQRPRDKALAMLEKIIQIYQGKDGTAQTPRRNWSRRKHTRAQR